MNANFTADGLRYPGTYQRELSPAWISYTAALNGGQGVRTDRPFRYLELGCGEGYSALLHAASYPHGEFHAVDLDARAVTTARERANTLGLSNLHATAARFDELGDLAPFDFIVLHGVYSWVDASVRTHLHTILREKLVPGGLAYVSYNCLPGWAAEMPLRRLFREIAHASDAIDPYTESAAAIDRLRDAGLGYFSAHPTAARAVRSWEGRPAGYLASEYADETCEPLWAHDVIDALGASGLVHAGSATLHDNHEALLVDDATAAEIAALATPRLRSLALDFAVNRSFRRDVFVREGKHTNPLRLADVLLGSVGDLADTIRVPRGQVRFSKPFVAAVARAVATGPASIATILSEISHGADRTEATRNLLWLIAGGALSPFAASKGQLAPRAATAMLEMIAANEVPGWIATPRIGGGYALDPQTTKALLDGEANTQTRTNLQRLGVL